MAFLNETGLEQVWGKIKTKVNTIENTIDDINEAKVDKVSGKGLSTNDYTTDEKNKLAGIAAGATKVIVDSTLDSTSENAIQNKVVANMKSDIDDTLSTKLDTITTSGNGNIITDISKSGTTINAEKNAFATTVKEGNPVSEIGIAGTGFSVKTIFEPIQAGSGEPSPTNIRPISGFNSINIVRCGKNLLKNTLESQTINGVTITNNGDGTYTLNGTATGNFTVYVDYDKKVPLSAYGIERGKQYKLVGCPAGGAEWRTYQLYLNVTGNGTNYIDIGNGIVFTPTDEDMNSTYNVGLAVMRGVNCNNLVFRPMLTDDLTTTYDDFVQYQGDTYTADFGQTVYGGILDWQTGVLTVDRAFYTFDGSEGLTSGGWNNPYSYVLWSFLPDVVNCGMSDIADAYCSHYAVGSVANVITNEIAGFGIYDSGHLIFSSPTHADADAFKAYLAAQYAAGTPVQVCYKLATPQTIQLTPHDLRMLDGVNTVYSDGNTNYVIFNSGVSSLAQVDKNYLKLTGGTLSGNFTIKNGATWPNLTMKSTSYSDKNTGIIYNSIPSGSAVNYLGFRTYSRSSSDYSLLDYYENFELPSTSSNRTSNASYSILTSKYAVTIAQGGTGATTASGARTNLEVPSKTGEGASGTWGINISGTSARSNILINNPFTVDNIDSVTDNGLHFGTVSNYAGPGFQSSDALILSMSWDSNNSYGAQLAFDDLTTANMYVRNKNNSWSNWEKVLLSNNYTDYTVKKDGTGASGTWGINVTGSSKNISYPAQLTTDDAINAFNTANTFQVATWNNTSSPGVGNGIIINAGWTAAGYGAQIAIDDDPTYYMALRQRDTSGWNAWKRIPMGDGTGASGTWGIHISGTAATATKLATARTLTIGNKGKTFDGSGNVSWSLSEIGAATASHGTHVTNSTVQVFDRATIGTSPNFDNPGINGLFEIRTTSETPGETGTKPFDSFGPFLNLKTPDNIAMLQIAANGREIMYRANQAGGVTMSGVAWKTLLSSSNYNSYSPTLTGSGASGTWGISITGGAAAAIQDGNGNVINSTYLKLSGGTLSGALNFANNTWNTMGDDAYIGDCNTGGCIGIKGKNGATGLYFAPYSGSTAQSITINGNGLMSISGKVSSTFQGTWNGNAIGVSYGGTGSTSKSGARTNLGIVSGTSLPSASDYAAGDIFILY